jgi:hypothetical protein
VVVGLEPYTDLWLGLSAMVFAALLEDLGDSAGTDRAAALTDGEAQALVHGDRLAELDGELGVVPGMTISVPSGRLMDPVTSVVRK